MERMCAVAVWVTFVICSMVVDYTSGQSTAGRLQVRLGNGETTSKYRFGRVEISRDGVTWETICDKNFDKNQAVAVCAMLSFSHGEAIGNTTYGEGEGSISAAGFECGGGATSLNDCYQYVSNERGCNHTNDIGVFCFNNTKDVFQIRLANESGVGNIRIGRLEVRLGTLPWGSVCYTRFTEREADVACKEMGYKHGEVHFGELSGMVPDFWLSDLYCQKPNTSLLDCFDGKFGQHNCFAEEYVGLRCVNATVRLKTSTENTLNAGTVELYKEGLGWMEVCDDGWDDNEAKVVCRELGFADGRALCCSQLGASRWGSLTIQGVYRNLSCTGSEQSLFECPMTRGRDTWACPFDKDDVTQIGSVICYENPYNQQDSELKIRLTKDQKLTQDPWGMLEIRRYGLWGQVCMERLEDPEAAVACRMLGYAGGRALGHAAGTMTTTSGPVWLTEVTCLGNETSLEMCKVERWGLPKPACYSNPSVICYERELDIRLSGPQTGSQPYGRLDIAYDGVVGTVCADDWNDKAASIACKTLGYQDGKVLTENVSGGSGPVYLSGVTCSYGDKTLFQCDNAGWKQLSEACSANTKNAGVSCFQDVRLNPGSHRVGVVQVYDSVNDIWDAVCGKTFDDNAARVTCRQLGFQYGLALPEAVYGYHLGPYKYTGLTCTGSEDRLADCSLNTTVTSCIPFSYAYASVSCYDRLETVTFPYILTSGPATGGQTSGLLKIYRKGVWGYACDEFWTSNDANVLCKELGASGGISMRYPGTVEGPFLVMHAGCQGNETSLDQCKPRAEPCDYKDPAGVLCYKTLTGAPKLSLHPEGGVPHQGRLMLTVDGEEGRVCADNWDNTDADVACRQLGYRNGVAMRYPKTSGPVFLSNMGCYGYEETLFRCVSKGWRQYNETSCNGENEQDAGVFCFNSVRLSAGEVSATQISGDLHMHINIWQKVCAAGFDSSDSLVVCRELGFTNSAILTSARYEYGVTYVTNLSCRGNEASAVNCSYSLATCGYKDGGVRMVCFNGDVDSGWKWTISDTYRGLVRVKHLGITGVVCEQGWTDNEASALCRYHGYKGGKALGTMGVNAQHELVWMMNVTCPDSARDITACTYNTNVSKECRETLGSAGVLCYNESEPQFRLADGGKNYGRVEINYDGTWGTICDYSWTKYDASALCKQLGFVDGVAYTNSFYGPGTGPVYLNNMRCRGDDKSLLVCPNSGWGDYSNECTNHTDDASVHCFPNLRLQPRDDYGAAELWSGYNYVSVCDDGGFDDVAAGVVCRELGYRVGKYLCCSTFGALDRRVGVGQVSCTGAEEKFENCMMRRPITDLACPHLKYASVVCSNQDEDGAYKVSLSEGHFGQVQVEYYSKEGLVCYNGFDNDDAHVACKEAGYATGKAYRYRRSRYGVVTEIRWLTNLNCTKSSTRLADCSHNGWGHVPGCSLDSDAAAFCFQTEDQAAVRWRLAGGDTPQQGRVEVQINGTWGTVCGLSVTDREVSIICRATGYPSGSVESFSRYGAGSGPVWLSQLQCPEKTNDIFQCLMAHPGLADERCNSHGYDLAVQCHSGVQVVGGLTGHDKYGRVEVYSQDRETWVAVCDDGFTDHTAQLVCRDLGQQYATRQCCSALGVDTFPFPRFANVTCRDQDTTLNSCLMNKSAGVTCPSGHYATVFCSDNDRSQEVISVDLRDYAGMPMATRFGIQGSICGKGFTNKEAGVLCRELGYVNGYALGSTPTPPSKPVTLGRLNCTGNETSISECQRGSFNEYVKDCGVERSAANVLCSRTHDPIKYRINPEGFNVGRGELWLNGEWRLISRIGFATEEATVFCRGAGYNNGIVESSRVAGLAQETVALSEVRCRGNETTLLECDGDWTSETNVAVPSSLGVYVHCFRSVKLERGQSSSNGIVQVYRGGWGPVCGNKFDENDAKVVCRELGYLRGMPLCCSPYGYNFDDPVMAELECTGKEESILDCPHQNELVLLRSCSRQNYAAVACYNETHTQDYSLSFAGGSNYTGALMINFLGVSGRICNDTWDERDAYVACRELGFEQGVAYSHYRAAFTYYETDGPFWSSGFKCEGNESRLGDCPHVGFGNVSSCQGNHFAGALCYNDKGISYRLAGGKNNYGRVEVFANGEWGTVCDRYWDTRDAAVICRTLGFVDGATRHTEDLGAATGTVWGPDLRCEGQESDLNDCLHQGWLPATDSFSCSSHTRDAGAFCYFSVRLSSGPGDSVNHGAVHFFYDNQWFRVCDAQFDDVTARAVCQELGFVDGRVICCSAYGGVNMRYEIHPNVTIHCDGSESTFSQCVKEEPCHSELYASVVCSGDAEGLSNPSYTIKRRVPTSSYGPLSVTQYGVQGRICSANWTDEDANVFCRHSGFTAGFAFRYSHKNDYPTETEVGPYWLSGFNCTGNESSLLECPYNDRLSLGNCSTDHTAAVACYDESGIEYRLAGGNATNRGRVELAIDGRWGTVCDLYFDKADADVICRSLNFTSGEVESKGSFGDGTGPIWLRDIQCKGTEAALHRCPHGGFSEDEGTDSGWGWWFFSPPCSTHDDDAAVSCYGSVKLNRKDTVEGGLQVYNNGRWSGVCDDSFSNMEATVACRSLLRGFNYGVAIKGSVFGKLEIGVPVNITYISCTGHETDITQCAIMETGTCRSGHYVSVHCSETPINDTGFALRIAEDSYGSHYHGIVEVNIGGVWGRICHQHWQDDDANVVCRQLGFKGGVAYLHIYLNTRPILVRNVSCTGSETSLEQCHYDVTPDLESCGYGSNDAGVVCYNSTGIQYRLNGGNNTSGRSGRVEIGYDGSWGSVCSWQWTSYDSKVLCRNLKYVDGIPEVPEQRLPKIEAFLNGAFCEGHESTILKCLNTGFNSTFLDYLCFGEAYTSCYSSEVSVTNMRLVKQDGNTSTTDGRVEVYVNGPNAWGTICDDYWDDTDATVVCRSLGHDYGLAITNLTHGAGEGRIWLDNVECVGNETELLQCEHRGLGTHNCEHFEDAGVICRNSTTTTMPVATTAAATTLSPTPKPTTTSTTTTAKPPTTTPSTTTTTTKSTTITASTTTTTARPPTPTRPLPPPTRATETTTTSTTSASTTTDMEGGTASAHTGSNKTLLVAVLVPVIIVLLLIAAILAVVIFKLRNRKSIPHQRFTDDIMNQSADGSIAMHNQMFDMSAADTGNDPLSESTKYMAADPEITLGRDGNARYSSHNGEGVTDNGFTNPLYSVMREPPFPSDTAKLHNGNDADAANGSHI